MSLEYFCPKCQKRHPVNNIAADLSDFFSAILSGDDCTNMLSIPDDENANNIRMDISDNLMRSDDLRRHFVWTYERASEMSNGDSANNEHQTDLFCTLKMSLSQLLDLYRKWAEKKYSDDSINAYEEALKASGKYESVLFDAKIAFTFKYVKSIAGNGEEQLDTVFDSAVIDCMKERKTFKNKCCFLSNDKFCGFQLSEFSGMAPEIVVAMAGGARAGKTVYVLSLIKSLREHGEEFGITLYMPSSDNPIGKATNTLLDQYNKGEIADKTKIEKKAQDLTYSFRIEVNRKEGQKTSAENRVFTVIDMPGEFWSGKNGEGLQQQEFMDNYRSIYSTIDFLWFFVSNVGVLNKEIVERKWETIASEVADSKDIIKAMVEPAILKTTITTVLHSLGRMPPTALVTTKTDYIFADEGSALREQNLREIRDYELFPVESDFAGNLKIAYGQSVKTANEDDLYGFNGKKGLIKVDSDKVGHRRLSLNLDVFARRVSMVKNYLSSSNHVPSLVTTFRDNFDCKTFLALASYGHLAFDPKNRENESKDFYAGKEEPTPYRVLYPFFWSLALSGLIPIVVQYQKIAYSFGRPRIVKGGTGNADILVSSADNIEDFKNPDVSRTAIETINKNNNPHLSSEAVVKLEDAAGDFLTFRATVDKMSTIIDIPSK